jgi:hypothetical protein
MLSTDSRQANAEGGQEVRKHKDRVGNRCVVIGWHVRPSNTTKQRSLGHSASSRLTADRFGVPSAQPDSATHSFWKNEVDWGRE